MFKLLMTM